MKGKTINAVIRKKINEWLESIDDPAVREIASKNAIVTGGAIVSLLTDEPVSDYDIYLRTHEACKKITEYYLSKFKVDHSSAAGVRVEDSEGRIRLVTGGAPNEDGTAADKVFEFSGGLKQEVIDPNEAEDRHGTTETAEVEPGTKYNPVFLTSNAITLADKIQIVIRFSGEPDAIHLNYDFVHCTNYWTSWDDHLELRKEALESILTRELRYVGSKYPICSIIRIRKFVKRGWTINAGQILKMIIQSNELDLTKIEVLREQLVGVDALYFFDVIDGLKEKDPDKVNSAYLFEIIDRVF